MESVCSFGLVVRRVGSFTYTPRAGNFLVLRRVGSLSDTSHSINFLVVRRVGSFSYTPRAGIYLVVKRIMSFSYTLRVGNCLVLRWVGNLFYTPRASMSCFRFARVSVTHRIVGHSSEWGQLGCGWVRGESLLHAPCSSLSGLSSGGETLFQALYWNLSHRSVGGWSLLNAPC